jgi:hypothetical protein
VVDSSDKEALAVAGSSDKGALEAADSSDKEVDSLAKVVDRLDREDMEEAMGKALEALVVAVLPQELVELEAAILVMEGASLAKEDTVAEQLTSLMVTAMDTVTDMAGNSAAMVTVMVKDISANKPPTFAKRMASAFHLDVQNC